MNDPCKECIKLEKIYCETWMQLPEPFSDLKPINKRKHFCDDYSKYCKYKYYKDNRKKIIFRKILSIILYPVKILFFIFLAILTTYGFLTKEIENGWKKIRKKKSSE